VCVAAATFAAHILVQMYGDDQSDLQVVESNMGYAGYLIR